MLRGGDLWGPPQKEAGGEGRLHVVCRRVWGEAGGAEGEVEICSPPTCFPGLEQSLLFFTFLSKCSFLAGDSRQCPRVECVQ